MNELALFAGAGGGILGSHLLGWKTVCAVEIEDYPRRVLLARQKDGLLPRFPIWDDIKNFDGKIWRGRVDIVTGGFPCQDISCAGKGKGITGERSGLWSEMARIIGEVRPKYAFVENSPMLVRRGLAVVISVFAEMGYACKWGIVGAHHAGGPHKRDRIWILANSMSPREWRVKREKEIKGHVMANTSNQGLQRCEQQAIFPEGRGQERGAATQCRGSWWGIDPADLPDTQCYGLQGGQPAGGQTASVRRRSTEQNQEIPNTDSSGFQTPGAKQQTARVIDNRTETERSAFPELGRVVNELANRLDLLETAFGGQVQRVGTGIKNRVARLKAIGNGQVPCVMSLVWKLLDQTLDYEKKEVL